LWEEKKKNQIEKGFSRKTHAAGKDFGNRAIDLNSLMEGTGGHRRGKSCKKEGARGGKPVRGGDFRS